MSDYISRDEIFSVWRSMPKPASISSLTDAINQTPAADVEPVRHGRWVNMGGFPACSECACSPAIWEPKPNNPRGFPEWCSGCGAKMDLEDENNDDCPSD